MTIKIEELVEWVAKENIAMPVMRDDCKCETWVWGRSATCPTCTARQILSHPDLAEGLKLLEQVRQGTTIEAIIIGKRKRPGIVISND